MKNEVITKEDLRIIAEQSKDLLLSLVKSIVDKPEDVTVNITLLTYRITLEMVTAVEDVGHVLGRGATLLNSIKAIIHAIAGKNQVAIDLEYITERESLMKRNRERNSY